MSAVAADLPETVAPASTKAIAPSKGGRPWTFYVLATLFTLYVLALYGPMFCIYILSFQDITLDKAVKRHLAFTPGNREF